MFHCFIFVAKVRGIFSVPINYELSFKIIHRGPIKKSVRGKRNKNIKKQIIPEECAICEREGGGDNCIRSSLREGGNE